MDTWNEDKFLQVFTEILGVLQQHSSETITERTSGCKELLALLDYLFGRRLQRRTTFFGSVKKSSAYEFFKQLLVIDEKSSMDFDTVDCIRTLRDDQARGRSFIRLVLNNSFFEIYFYQLHMNVDFKKFYARESLLLSSSFVSAFQALLALLGELTFDLSMVKDSLHREIDVYDLPLILPHIVDQEDDDIEGFGAIRTIVTKQLDRQPSELSSVPVLSIGYANAVSLAFGSTLPSPQVQQSAELTDDNMESSDVLSVASNIEDEQFVLSDYECEAIPENTLERSTMMNVSNALTASPSPNMTPMTSTEFLRQGAVLDAHVDSFVIESGIPARESDGSIERNLCEDKEVEIHDNVEVEKEVDDVEIVVESEVSQLDKVVSDPEETDHKPERDFLVQLSEFCAESDSEVGLPRKRIDEMTTDTLTLNTVASAANDEFNYPSDHEEMSVSPIISPITTTVQVKPSYTEKATIIRESKSRSSSVVESPVVRMTPVKRTAASGLSDLIRSASKENVRESPNTSPHIIEEKEEEHLQEEEGEPDCEIVEKEKIPIPIEELHDAIAQTLEIPLLDDRAPTPSFRPPSYSVLELRNPYQVIGVKSTECEGCGSSITHGVFSSARFCYQYCSYFCRDCYCQGHGEETRPIPFYLLMKGMCKRLPVCHAAAVDIDAAYYLCDVDCRDWAVKDSLMPLVTKKTKLSIMNRILSVCPSRAGVLSEFGDRIEWFRKPYCFSLSELALHFEEDGLVSQIDHMYERLNYHINTCENCKVQGRFCPTCHKNEILFAFDFERIVKCARCGTVYHAKCFDRCLYCELSTNYE
ncbi:hypothetical protein PCE1_003880 [Barthelona sp. PCE]